MNKAQELMVRQSEKREALNAIMAKGDPTDEDRAKAADLRKELQELEPELRAAIEAQGKREAEAEAERRAGANGDGEHAERRALVENSKLATYMDAAANQRQVSGREAELSAAFSLPLDKAPWELMLPPGGAEHRAATGAPATTADVQHMPVLGRLFASSDTMFLGVETPMVGPGERLYTTVATGVEAADVNEATDIDGEAVAAATWRVVSAAPKAISASYEWSMEDAHTFGPLESTLRTDLRRAMTTALDKRVVDPSACGAWGPDQPYRRGDLTPPTRTLSPAMSMGGPTRFDDR